MGINHLELSQEMMNALFPDSLVQPGHALSVEKDIQKTMPATRKQTALVYMGKNLRSVCFLTCYPEGEFLPPDQLVFLGKMLSACKYSMEDISLVNTASQTPGIAQIKQQFKPWVLFLWGIKPESAGFAPGLPDFAISEIDGLSVIPVPGTGLMSSENPEGIELKKRLWTCLKKIFTL